MVKLFTVLVYYFNSTLQRYNYSFEPTKFFNIF